MKPALRWAMTCLLVGAVGLAGAGSYARLLAPAYAATLRLIAGENAWQVSRFTVDDSGPQHALVLRVGGEVHRTADPSSSAAKVNLTRTAGSLVELAVVFWVLVLGWPVADRRQRLRLIALGLPVLLVVDVLSTGASLAGQFADARAMLQFAADTGAIPEGNEAWSGWEHWSRFLEGGGRVALAVVLALVVIAMPRPRSSTAAERASCTDQDAKSPPHSGRE